MCTQNAGNDTALQCTVTLVVPKAMTPPVYVYYELDGVYQNHRRCALVVVPGAACGQERVGGWVRTAAARCQQPGLSWMAQSFRGTPQVSPPPFLSLDTRVGSSGNSQICEEPQ